MINTKAKADIIRRIRASKTFSKASTSSALLNYLFEASQKGIDLKEASIELDFFGKLSKGNNPRVRVNIYNLRKKLDQYYTNEGKREKWQVHIDKGQYQLSFHHKSSSTPLYKRIKPQTIVPYAIALIILIFYTLSITPPKKPAIWPPFLSNTKPCNVFIGDVFGVMGPTATGANGWNRDYSINSLEQLYDFCDENPELKDQLKPANYTYTTGMAVYSVQNIQKLFLPYKKDFNIRFTTQSSIADVKSGNSIYVGPIKNNNKFLDFFNDNNPHFAIKNSRLYFSNHTAKKDTAFALDSEGTTEEYAIVSRIPGPDNSDLFIFFSDHGIGTRSTVEYFTNKDSISTFHNKYLQSNQYFTAVFLAKGKDRTNTSLKLIMVDTFN